MQIVSNEFYHWIQFSCHFCSEQKPDGPTDVVLFQRVLVPKVDGVMLQYHDCSITNTDIIFVQTCIQKFCRSVITVNFMFQSGLVQGVMHLLLLSMSAHLTKELGMAPGGEFRQALKEVEWSYSQNNPNQFSKKKIFWQFYILQYIIISKFPCIGCNAELQHTNSSTTIYIWHF